jgi:hypothetical protein
MGQEAREARGGRTAPNERRTVRPHPGLPLAEVSEGATSSMKADTARAILASSRWLASFGPTALHHLPTEAGFHTAPLPSPGRRGSDRGMHLGPVAQLAEVAGRALPVVFSSDADAMAALTDAGLHHQVLDEPGDGWALWRVAHGLQPEFDTIHLNDLRSRAELAAALAAVALPPVPSDIQRITSAALRLALDRWLAPEAALSPSAREALAQGIGLSPVPSVRADGLPFGLPAEIRDALAGSGTLTVQLFRMVAGHLAARGGGDAHPSPLARPVLLASLPVSSEPGETVEIMRYRPLRDPVAAVPPPDPAAVGARLRSTFPWMGEAIAVVTRELALAALGTAGVCRIPPLLLIGPPGAGKTTLARALADACGLPLHRLAAPDTSAATQLGGLGRGWRSARPCMPLRAILEGGVRNPIICVDDVDRAPVDDRNGTVSAVLLALLEPESARGYEDPLLAVTADLSSVNWILTANSASGLPDALLDRLVRVDVPHPPLSALGGIVAAMLEAIAGELGVERAALPPLPAAVHRRLAEAFAADCSALRRIRLGLRQALGAAALGDDPVAAAHAALGLETISAAVGFPRTATLAR